ncbi:MAG: glycosyltransferase [Bacteroidaceae bacterium]
MTAKRVSVVCCTYNGAAFLAEQLDSILAQTYPPFEVIVQDDGSTDDTLAILKDYAQRFPSIHLYNNVSKQGINANFFSAMQRATGDFIAISDQDDIWEPRKLALQVEAIGDNLLCGGRSMPFSSDGFPVAWDARMPNIHLLRLLYLGEVNGHTMLLHRTLLTYFPEGGFNCPYLYDWQLQIVAAAADRIVMLSDVLVHFRRHSFAATATIPTGHSLFRSQGFKFLWFPVAHHKVLQGVVRERFSVVLKILRALPFETEALKSGLEMAALQASSGSMSRGFKMMCFFVHHRSFLFHTVKQKPCVSFLRSVFYLFTCGWYYRGVLVKVR